MMPRPNVQLTRLVADLPAGDALDLGCGNGGDALWLARHGWRVTAVDISPTAIARITSRAVAAGLDGSVQIEQHDLGITVPAGPFDLVNAHYLHSPTALDRSAVLRRAAATISVLGSLLLVDHASTPPWSWADSATVYPTPEQTLLDIGLDLDQWRVVRADASDRTATGPGGQHALVTDNVIFLTKEQQ